MLDDTKVSREIIQRREFVPQCEPRSIIKEVAASFGVTESSIMDCGSRGNKPRNVAIYLVKRNTELSNDEIAGMFGGISGSAVSKAAIRLEGEMIHDLGLAGTVENVMSNVKT